MAHPLEEKIIQRIATLPKYYIGIDLGGHSSIVSSAAEDPENTKRIISVDVNTLSNRSTPTIVSFDNRLKLVGEEAETKMITNPSNSINHITQLLGIGLDEIENVKKRFKFCLRFLFIKDEQNNSFTIPIKFDKERYEVTSEYILSIYIKYLVGLSQSKHQGDISNIQLAISLPSHYNEKQLMSVRVACRIAGIENVKLFRSYECMISCWREKNLKSFFNEKINSFYRRENKNESEEEETKEFIYVSFFDYGYSQTTFVVVKFEREKNIMQDSENEKLSEIQMKIMARKTNSNLGVHEIIMSLMNEVIRRTNEKHKTELDWNNKRGLRLYNSSLKAMKELSGLTDAFVHLEGVLENEEDVEMKINRDEFENICTPIKEEINKLLEEVVAECQISKEDICACEVIGGGSRIPFVLNCLNNFFKNSEKIENSETVKLESDSNDNCNIIRKTLDSSSAISLGCVMCAMDMDVDSAVYNNSEELSLCKSFSEEEIQRLIDILRKMQDVENNELQRMKCKNELEAFILYLKTEMNGKHKDLLKNEKLISLIEQKEDWLSSHDNDNTTFTEYNTELTDLKTEAETLSSSFFEAVKKEAEEKEQEMKKFEKDQQNRSDDADIKLPPAQAIKKAKKNKEEGNDLLKTGNVELAILRYIKCLQYLNKLYDASPNYQEEINSLKLATNLNLAQSYIKIGSEITMKKAVSCCSSALEIDENNLKALFRRAVAKEALKDYDSAMIDIQTGLKFFPNDSDFCKINERIKKHLKIQKNREKEMYSKMFS